VPVFEAPKKAQFQVFEDISAEQPRKQNFQVFEDTSKEQPVKKSAFPVYHDNAVLASAPAAKKTTFAVFQEELPITSASIPEKPTLTRKFGVPLEEAPETGHLWHFQLLSRFLLLLIDIMIITAIIT
jgi:hypothetical protein